MEKVRFSFPEPHARRRLVNLFNALATTFAPIDGGFIALRGLIDAAYLAYPAAPNLHDGRDH
jgi:hypothetical protein